MPRVIKTISLSEKGIDAFNVIKAQPVNFSALVEKLLINYIEANKPETLVNTGFRDFKGGSREKITVI